MNSTRRAGRFSLDFSTSEGYGEGRDSTRMPRSTPPACSLCGESGTERGFRRRRMGDTQMGLQQTRKETEID